LSNFAAFLLPNDVQQSLMAFNFILGYINTFNEITPSKPLILPQTKTSFKSYPMKRECIGFGHLSWNQFKGSL